jgi:tRNA modification GTPase
MITDTICAVSTPVGTGALALIRVSGNDAIKEVNKIFKGKNLEKAKSHTVHYGHLLNEDGTFLDEVMVSVLRAPKTFTREDMVEISIHGGMLLTQKVLERLLKLDMRLARPGEFSERAYLNGRIDLVQAEAIMDVIHAKNINALKIASLGLTQETSKLIKNLRDKLVNVIAQIEVNIDYPEYDDAVVMSKEIIYPATLEILKDMKYLLEHSYQNQLIRDGISTAIIGKPNVGKSSLLNALLNEDKAIVTDIAGTTRDTIEAELNLGGITLKLIDTAGIRDTDDVVEKIGVERSLKALDKAQLVLVVLDQSRPLDEIDYRLLEAAKKKPSVVILNKDDLESQIDVAGIKISALQKQGFRELETKILEVLSLTNLEERDFNYLSNTRHIAKVNDAIKSLENVLESINLDMPVDIYAIDLTNAWQSLGDIIGVRYQDELLDTLFSKFCLGK